MGIRARSRTGGPLLAAFAILAACSSGTPATPSVAPASILLPTAAATEATPAPLVTFTPAPTPTVAPISTVAPVTTLPASTIPAAATPTAGTSPGGPAFLLAGMTLQFEQNAAAPDPSTFATSFPTSSPAIYVEFVLRPGLTGTVTGTWNRADGTTVNSTSITYPASAPWAWFKMYAFTAPGDYDYVIRFAPTGEEETLHFSLVGPPASAAPSAAASPAGSPGQAFTLLTMATSADTSQSAPDPSTFVTSYPADVDSVFMVFILAPKLTGKVTGDLLFNGTSLLSSPVSLEYHTTNSWGNFEVTLNGRASPGIYTATLTYAPTNQSQSIQFTLTPVASFSP